MKAKVTINGKEHEITLTDEQIKQVSNNWRNEYLKMFTLFGYGSICISSTSRSSITEFCFQNNEIANEVISKINILIEMTQFALLRNNGWVADWIDKYQTKYGICCQNKKPFCTLRCTDNDFIFGISVKSNEIAEEMLSIFKEDIEKYYN